MGMTSTLAFVGDTSLGEWYIKQVGAKVIMDRLENDPFSFFSDVHPLVDNCSHIIANFESVLADNPSIRIEGKEYPNWDHPKRTIESLQRLGITAVSFNNNHAMDFGSDLMLFSKSVFDSSGICVFGAGVNLDEAAQPFKISIAGDHSNLNIYILAGMNVGPRYERFNFFAGENSPGINPLIHAVICAEIQKIRKTDEHAVIIVFPHWQGYDYKWATEKPVIRNFCRAFVDAGANYILGHGPHMLNDVEIYGGGVIAYSIGNFVFNSPGRYKKFGVPPYSLIVRLEVEELQDTWKIKPLFYPIYTDNRSTGYKTAPITDDRVSELSKVLNERSKNLGINSAYNFDRNQYGSYFVVKNIDEYHANVNNKVLSLILGNQDINDIDLNDATVVEQILHELEAAHSKIDTTFKKLYDSLSKSMTIRHNISGTLKKLSGIAKKEYITHGMIRRIESKKHDIDKAISFSDILIENSQKRRIGCHEYAWLLDEKTEAYKFADSIGLRRPSNDGKIYKFNEINKPTTPVVIKPVHSTGSMGVYLLYNDTKILSAREGVYLNNWSELQKDALKKLKGGKLGKNPLLLTDKWIIEELILSAEGSTKPANDLKFYCFYGEILLVLEANRACYGQYCFWDTKMNLVDTGWNAGAIQLYRDGVGFTQEDMDLVISVSLQIPVPYIRIDMLKGHDGLVFGEATPRPGKFHSFNAKYDRILGEAYRRAENRILTDLLNGKKFNAFTELLRVKKNKSNNKSKK